MPISISALLLCNLLRLDCAVPELSPALDWPALLSTARAHQLSPYLYHRLKSAGLERQLPEPVLSGLQQDYRSALSLALRRSHALQELLLVFHRSGIPCIPLKGAYLAEVIYPNPALRTMSDLDLLVPKEQLAQAAQFAQNLGYRPERRYLVEGVIELHSHLPVLAGKNLPFLEIHATFSRPIDPFPVVLEGVWQRARPLSFLEVPAFTLAPEDLLLSLSLHIAYQHCFNQGLRSLLDLALVVQRMQGEISWELLLARAADWSAGLPLYLSLALAHELLGAPLPTFVLTALQPPDLDPALLPTTRHLALTDPRPEKELKPEMLELVQAETWPKKLHILLQRVFLPPRVLAVLYPARADSPWIYWYYPARLVTLLRQYGSTVWNEIWGGPSQKRITAESRARAEQQSLLLSQMNESVRRNLSSIHSETH